MSSLFKHDDGANEDERPLSGVAVLTKQHEKIRRKQEEVLEFERKILQSNQKDMSKSSE